MKFSLRKLSVIEDDLTEAGLWYEDQNPGVGLSRALVEETDAVILTLRTDALFHRVRFRDVRRAPLSRFGFYGVYYVVRGDAVIVIAVFHDRRDRARMFDRRREVEGDL